MKTKTKHKLVYDKHEIVELNDSQIKEINGGTSVSTITFTSASCLAVMAVGVVVTATLGMD